MADAFETDRNPLLFCKLSNLRLELGHSHIRARKCVVKGNEYLLRIEDLVRNLVERLERPCARGVVGHYQIEICEDEISGINGLSAVLRKDFFSECLSHESLKTNSGS